jgi:class 3 adenylate cyclase
MKQLLDLKINKIDSLKYLGAIEKEVGELFGYPLPRLPHGDEGEEGRKRIFVDLFPNLGLLFREWLQVFYPVVTGKSTVPQDHEYVIQLREMLIRTATQAILQGRRNGLYNLFFLALSKVLPEMIDDFLSQGGRKPYHKYLLHSPLSSLLMEVNRSARQQVEGSEPGGVVFHLGLDYNESLIRAILHDQLPCITKETEEVTVQEVLGIHNPRFPLSMEGFREIYRILSGRLRRGVEKKEEDWIAEIQETAGLSGPAEQLLISKVLNDPQVVRFLMLDHEVVAKKIMASRHVGGKKVRYASVCKTYLDLLSALKRNEVIQLLKRGVEILSDRQAGRSEELYSFGSLYRFLPEGKIVNDARNVTTVFLDLRGFTRKSEEAISAEELTDQLYALFDPVVPLVREFHGEIDKFTGDGIMVTFGVDSRKKEDALNALRLAIRVQEVVRSLRSAGKTEFKMGISIHSGTVFVAHFIAGDDSVDRTVIGRNVNIAGRLSSAGDLRRQEEEQREFESLVESLSFSLESSEERSGFLETVKSRKPSSRTISGVSVDAQGNLYNQGIVLSQQTIQAIGKRVPLQSGEDQELGFFFFHDPILSRKISLYYVGDVKFKGVESAFPVYAVLQ